ncbi:MAG: response regulator [Pirellulaceae bacterium]|nr:response regulator [Planctomycetota bacterium]
MNPTLLITDDDAGIRNTLCEVFAASGIRTLLAKDGQEAIDLLNVEPVHVGLFDLQMPRISGIETIAHIRSRGLDVSCILMSAALDDEVIAQARRQEVYSVLAKPFRCSAVARVVREALAQFHGWRE